MSIIKSKFPNQLFVLGNTKYFFGQIINEDNLLRVVRSFDCDKIATVHITALGGFGFVFPDEGELASIDFLKFVGNGTVPEEVMENDDEIHSLQEKRMLFVNFISAAFFGRISAKSHKSLNGAIHNGQDKIAGFSLTNDEVALQRTEVLDQAIGDKLRAFKAGKCNHCLLGDPEIDDGISYVRHLLQRQNDFEYADLRSCMVINYQAAILHKQQHAAASLALNFSVIEPLSREIFLAYGLVAGSIAKSFATKEHTIAEISKRTFKNMKLHQIVKMLRDGGLLGEYLYLRLETARKKRNSLMHKGAIISPKDSGDCQTIVRDLWLLLIGAPFELNASWSYRR